MKISAALIMKNEEENLPRLLKSLQGKFDEIVVVDTGSTDRSIEIAKEYGCKVYKKKWNGFADARNYAISKCEGKWIWHFDADFELEKDEFNKFQVYIRSYKEIPYDAINIYVKNFGLDGRVLSISSQTFIHKNKPQIKWIGDIHERVDVEEVIALPIFVNHYGYQKTNVQLQKAKRNLKLLESEIKNLKDKKEIFIKYFYFMQTYAILAYEDDKYNEKLKKIGEKFIDIFDEKRMNNHFFSYGMTYLVEAYLKDKDYCNAIRAINRALKIWNFHPDYLYKKAEILFAAKKYDLAKKYYLKFFEHAIDFQPGMKMVEVQVSESVNKIDVITEKILDYFTKEEIDEIYKNWKKEKNIYKIYLLLRYFEEHNDERFLKLFKKIEKIFYNNSFFEKYFAIYYFNRKNYEKSLQFAQMFLQNSENDKTINEIVAKIYYQKADYKNARIYFEKTLIDNYNIEIYPDYINTLKALGEDELVEKLQKVLKN
ncbi:tetratricopeptide repeat-containing glycosyltransferase family 2 protein [Nitratiruptor tergarcus]|uniref:Glycosyltransferase involved in cell wall bisynthesis n=1 Tax=Nitratiruptor tergarcus DSM 16512 TaxID=1069081 RepID=A0A1W1WSK6_9BACT|nr:glycosyltransferase [Nitratiruptor tergarcus]SMC09308.1 Glycosyltransferase involved in cell wall bisynthesis [Nitratiruptor tergarcus DSM 16512]